MKADPEANDVTRDALGKPGEEMNGTPSEFTCPDCGGSLWEAVDGDLVRYRCRTGHAFSPESLVASQAQALEATLWAAMRSFEETCSISRRMADRMRDKGLPTAESRYRERAQEAERHSEVLRRILGAAVETDVP